MKILLISFSCLAFAIIVNAQTPQLVKNINPTTVDPNSHSDPTKGNNPNYPDMGIFANGKIIFPALNYNGIELWQTDGTSSGTSILKDINSFGSFSDANPMYFTELNGIIYFFTADWDYTNNKYYNFRLRSLDTSAGIITTPSLTNNPFDYVSNVVVSQGFIYFIGYNSNNNGNSYFTTDTSIIQYDPSQYEGYTIINGGNPRELKVFGNNNLVFDANDSVNGRELWTYDITNTNAYMVLDINNSAPGASSNPHDFVTYNNQLYFTADDGSGSGYHLCYWDIINNFLSGTTFGKINTNPHDKIVYNNLLYFRIVDSVNNSFDIYSYDASNYSVNFVANDLNAGNGQMAIANNLLFFSANDGNYGNELWFTDGTNLSLTDDINVGGDSNPINLTPLNNQLLFVADDGNGPQIWVTDGNNNETTQMVDAIQTNDNLNPPIIFATDNNGFAYLFADDGTHGKELWKTDGTLAYTSLVKDINLGNYSSIGSNIQGMDVFQGNLFFGAYDGTSSNLYKADSLGNNVTLVASGSGAGFSSTYFAQDQIKKAGSYLFFNAADLANVAGYELWKTDGTQPGTMMVKDINPGTGWSSPNMMTECNGLLFFVADDGTHGRQLWKSDGTNGGTVMVKDIAPGTGTPNITNLNSIGTKVMFVATDSVYGTELWVSDGTDSGTHVVKDIYPGTNSSSPQNLKVVGSLLYFAANDSLHGIEPWISDGTSAGTVLLKDINPGAGSSNPSDFTQLGSYVYMAADSLGGQNTLWRTDGTTAGTHFFNSVTFPFNITNIGNKIVFLCDPQGAALGFEWWYSDGVTTSQLTDFGPLGVSWSYFNSITGFKNHGFVYIDDNVHGMELWQTDGTPGGTFVNDLAVGPLSSFPFILKGVDPMFFAADDGTSIGYELWKINVSTSVSWLNFTATLHDSTQAKLQWQTENETNNKGFIIQRSFDNKTYDSIGFVMAGSPNGASYSFIDSFLRYDSNYYRLQQIDLSNNIEYSNVEVVFLKKPLMGGIIISNESLCTGVQPGDIVDSIPASGGNISNCNLQPGIDPKFCYSYTWQDSLINGTWQNAVPAGSNPTYFFYSGALNRTTFFRRKVVDEDNDSAYSNIVSKVYKYAGDTSYVPSNAWNVYVYGGLGTPLSTRAYNAYFGYYSDTILNYNIQTDWAYNSNPTTAPNYQGCPLLPNNNFVLVLKRKGFTAGNYVLNMQYSGLADVLVNNVEFFSQTTSYYHANAPTISLGALDINSVVEIRIAEDYTYFGSSNLNLYFSQSNIQPGSINGSQTVCATQAPVQLGSSQDAYGGPAPLNIVYQWQDSATGSNWQNIVSANSDTYQPLALTDTTFYRRIAIDGQSTPVYSDTVTVNVIIVTQTPVLFKTGRMLSINPIAGAYNYKWFLNDTVISGANGLTYLATMAGSYTAKYTMQCGDGPSSNAITYSTNAISQNINFLQPSDVIYSPYQYIVLNATSSSGLPVTFNLTNGSAILSNDTVFILSAGTISLQANQQGNDLYSPAITVSQSFNVIPSNQTISFPSVPTKFYGDVPFDLQAVSSSGIPVSYTYISGPANLYGSAVYLTGVGNIVIKVSQPGNNNYNAAKDTLINICVGINNMGTISGDTSVCPNTVVYSVNSISGANYVWEITGGGIITPKGDSATVQWQTPGNYTVYVSGYSSCDSLKSPQSILNIKVNNVVPPGVVTNMLPANGTINLAFPLTLSWIPGTMSTSFDLYIWDADSSQPLTPFASGITSVSYTLSTGIAYHKSYMWRIISHSICGVTNGPVQSFSLIPLPDLLVTDVQSPTTAFSGQQIAISWKVTNIGPGNTNLNQVWSDAVFLSLDSLPDLNTPPYLNSGIWNRFIFPIRPLLVGVVPNLTALDSGQSYTNTVYFNLPLNYNWPLFAHVIANYSPGSNAPYEVSLLNDTANAPESIQVTLSPTPDLRVDSVLNPNSAFSGNSINILYKVKNYGVTTPPSTGWYDNIYISKDPFFDVNTATLLTQPKANGTYFFNALNATFSNKIQLQQDSFYDKLVSVVIPNFIYGTYYIYVFTDAGNNIYEGTNENNNVGSNTIQVFLTPTPSLIVSTLTTAVTTASTTQPVGINWTILNQGYYDNIEQDQGHYLETLNECSTCYIPYCPPPPPPDPCYYAGTCAYYYSCPAPAPGYSVRDSLSYGSSYWNDYIYLSNDSNELNINNAIYLGAYPHGAIDHGVNYDGVSSLPLLGSGIPYGTNASYYNINTSTEIYPGSQFSGVFNFNMPDTLTPGNYYVYVLADADSSVYEYPSQFKTKRSAIISVSRPDLTVPSVAVPMTIISGQTITINYTVQNIGPGNVFNHSRLDRVYMSTSSVFDANAQLIASPIYVENIPVNTPINHQITYKIPISISGIRYFYVITNADSSFKEINLINNLSSTTAQISIIAAPPSDLYVSSIAVPDTVFTVFGFPFKYSVPNQGTATTSGTWTDSIFISCSSSWDPQQAYGIAARTHSNILATGNNYVDSFNLTIPYSYTINNCFQQFTGAGYFYVKTNADNGVYEGTLINNNLLGTPSKIIINPLPDQIVTSVSADTNVMVGRNFTATWSVQNIGYNPGFTYYNAWNDAVFFSKDSVFDSNAILSGYFGEYNPLNANQSYTSTNSNFIVPNIATGNYYLFIKTNQGNYFMESRFDNNTNIFRNASGTPQLVHVVSPLLPDLIDTILSVPSISAIGQPIQLIYQVTNIGLGITYPSTWGDRFWLSTDYIPGTGNDIYLGGSNHTGTLLPGQSYIDTISLPINIDVPPGNYVLISATNWAGSIFETNMNNNLAFSYITIFSPSPCDLTVTNIIHPDTVWLGYPDTTTWSISNISPNSANGQETDGIYLSKNTVLDSTAVLLGTKTNMLNLYPLSMDTLNISPLLQGVAEGSYNVLVKTDILDNIVESNKDNNVGLSSRPVYVKVKQLPLNILTAGSLINNNLYYKMIIPDSLIGSTILVTLVTNDSLSVTNQIFVGGGYVPTAAHFDYTYNTPNAGNQQILMTTVTDSVYYITLGCVSPNPSPVQNITLLAVKLPFAILNVTANEGGNTGNVTVNITGSLFSNNMKAELYSASLGKTILASTVYFLNSTSVFATFNLQGQPLGLYDVSLIKTDSSDASLAQSFSIVNANNGGLITGSGVNQGQSGSSNSPGCDPGATSGLNAQLQTQVVIPPEVLAGYPFQFEINFSNPSNVDIPIQTRILYSENGLPISLTMAGLAAGTTSIYIEFSEHNGPPNIIRAGGSGSITIYAQVPANYLAHTNAYFNLK